MCVCVCVCGQMSTNERAEVGMKELSDGNSRSKKQESRMMIGGNERVDHPQ